MELRDESLLHDLLDGRLSPADEQDVRRRIAADPSWNEAWEELVRLRELLRADVGTPPADFVERVRAAAARSPDPARDGQDLGGFAALPRSDAQPGPERVASRASRDRVLRLVRFAYAAAAVLVVGLVVGFLLREKDASPVESAARTRTAEEKAGESAHLETTTAERPDEGPAGGTGYRAPPPEPLPDVEASRREDARRREEADHSKGEGAWRDRPVRDDAGDATRAGESKATTAPVVATYVLDARTLEEGRAELALLVASLPQLRADQFQSAALPDRSLQDPARPPSASPPPPPAPAPAPVVERFGGARAAGVISRLWRATEGAKEDSSAREGMLGAVENERSRGEAAKSRVDEDLAEARVTAVEFPLSPDQAEQLSALVSQAELGRALPVPLAKPSGSPPSGGIPGDEKRRGAAADAPAPSEQPRAEDEVKEFEGKDKDSRKNPPDPRAGSGGGAGGAGASPSEPELARETPPAGSPSGPTTPPSAPAPSTSAPTPAPTPAPVTTPAPRAEPAPLPGTVAPAGPTPPAPPPVPVVVRFIIRLREPAALPK